MLSPFLKGLTFGAGLIIAIGAQNAFVLRQGIRRNFVFVIALVSTLADMVLIFLGVAGLGSLIASSAWLSQLARWGGVLFLAYFGLRSLLSALKTPQEEESEQTTNLSSTRAAVMASLGFSLLNPHVYLDTVVLIGTLGATFVVPARWWFAAGAMLASAIWFFGLAYGAAGLAPLFEKPLTGRILDGIIAMIMWGIALSLLIG